MKTSLKLEEALQLIFAIYLFSQLELSWWWFIGLFLTPDIGMLGYLIGPRVGAFTYNVLHHKAIAIAILIAGYLWFGPWVQLVGIVLFGHAAFDRMLGYGLKLQSGFKNTHLGIIGK